jgi:hypothetical protein
MMTMERRKNVFSAVEVRNAAGVIQLKNGLCSQRRSGAVVPWDKWDEWDK